MEYMNTHLQSPEQTCNHVHEGSPLFGHAAGRLGLRKLSGTLGCPLGLAHPNSVQRNSNLEVPVYFDMIQTVNGGSLGRPHCPRSIRFFPSDGHHLALAKFLALLFGQLAEHQGKPRPGPGQWLCAYTSIRAWCPNHG